MSENETLDPRDEAVAAEQLPAEDQSTNPAEREPEQALLSEAPEGAVDTVATPEGEATPLPEDPVAVESQLQEPAESVDADQLLAGTEVVVERTDAQLRAVVQAIVYLTDEPLTTEQIAGALQQPKDKIAGILGDLIAEFSKPEHGISIQEVAGGYKMATKPEHHEAVRAYVRNLKPPLKLSLPALETLAVIAYKQPITAPEIMEIRGVQGAGVLKTLLDRKLIAAAGRKNVVGKPILYKTTKDFLLQFGLKDLGELPSLKEFEELRRMAITDNEPEPDAPAPETGVTATTAQESATAAEIETTATVGSEPAPAESDSQDATPAEDEPVTTEQSKE